MQRHWRVLASGRVLHVSYAVHVQPGRFVAGDVFDVISARWWCCRAPRRCLGRHGVGSGMLMAVTQAHVNAHLRASADIAGAIHSLNSYLCATSPRAGSSRSAWPHPAGRRRSPVHRCRSRALAHPASRRENPRRTTPTAPFHSASIRRRHTSRDASTSNAVIGLCSTATESSSSGTLRRVSVSITSLGRASQPVIPTRSSTPCCAALCDFAGTEQFDDDATIAAIELLDA